MNLAVPVLGKRATTLAGEQGEVVSGGFLGQRTKPRKSPVCRCGGVCLDCFSCPKAYVIPGYASISQKSTRAFKRTNFRGPAAGPFVLDLEDSPEILSRRFLFCERSPGAVSIAPCAAEGFMFAWSRTSKIRLEQEKLCPVRYCFSFHKSVLRVALCGFEGLRRARAGLGSDPPRAQP